MATECSSCLLSMSTVVLQCVRCKQNARHLLHIVAAVVWSTVSARSLFTVDSECTSCSYHTAHICISPFLFSEQLVTNIEKQISSRFVPCVNDSWKEEKWPTGSRKFLGRRGTVVVAVVECSSRRNWTELAELASIKWADKAPCPFDAIIILFHQWKLIPALAIRRNSSALWYRLQLRTYELSGKYGSEEAEQLVDELFSVMDVTERPPTVTPVEEGSTVREHVPDWAFVVIIISVLLSAIAFYIGTCINKRTSWRPFSGGKPKTAANRRLWGAGFSGGIWGAS